MNKVLILGAAGNVGRGLTLAFSSADWKVYAVDPVFATTTDISFSTLNPKLSAHADKEKSMESGQICRFPIKVEDIQETTIVKELFEENVDIKDHNSTIVICYAAEDGNRDNYASNPEIAKENNHRFSSFVRRLSKMIIRQKPPNESHEKTETNNRDINASRISVHIFYCGGSWTRRQMDNNFIVNDESPIKKNGGDNLYERAKTLSCSNAENLAMDHKDWCRITFIDYISVVPNYAPNFSIGRMVSDAVNKGKIVYSKGQYGRPLLHTSDAGRIIVELASRQLPHKKCGPFRILLLPGCFISFEQFAFVVKKAVSSGQKDKNKLRKLILEEQQFTPNFLRSHCVSKEIEEQVGIFTDNSLILDALRECAEDAIKKHSKMILNV